MAKKASNQRVDDERNPEYTQAEELVLELKRKFIELEAKQEGLESALLESSKAVDDATDSVSKLHARLDAEKESRVQASSSIVANMDQDELAKLILEVCLSHYLATEANTFSRLLENPNLLMTGSRDVIKFYNLFVKGIENALRVESK